MDCCKQMGYGHQGTYFTPNNSVLIQQAMYSQRKYVDQSAVGMKQWFHSFIKVQRPKKRFITKEL